jgi:chloramphenicol 3-O-phosphotransferase
MTINSGDIGPLEPLIKGPEHSISFQGKAHMLALMNEIRNRSLQIQAPNFFEKGDVTMFAGASTSGKTSTINALRKLEPNRLVDGIDIQCDQVWVKGLAKTFPENFLIAAEALGDAEIVHAVNTGSRLWKKGLSGQKKEAANVSIQAMKKGLEEAKKGGLGEEEILNLPPFNQLESYMYDSAIKASLEGKKIIFDHMQAETFRKHLDSLNFQVPVRVVLVYCPFTELSKRMVIRNKEAIASGDLENQRIGVFPLLQFAELFTQVKNGEPHLETITRDQAIKTFNENFDLWIEQQKVNVNTMPASDETQPDRKEQLQELLTTLGFADENTTEVKIGPKYKELYDIIVDTRNSPEEIAKMLHERGL